MHRRNIFAGPYLDRSTHLRQDPAWFDAALADAASRVVPVWQTRNLVTSGEPRHAVLLELRALPSACRPHEDLILLGRFGEHWCFAYEFEAIQAPQLADGAAFEDLRLVSARLEADEAGLLGYARAMVNWRRRHRFCGNCGSATVPARSGHAVVCSDASCRTEQFPRIDPAIIVLVSDGSRALLGRQATWPPGRYSTIAGFVEPGESLEDAVLREILEETGVVVDTIEYFSSQPWPFPASLMLGFTARVILAQGICAVMIVTRGKDGMSVIADDERVVHLPTAAREVFDVSGAGDTVVATLAVGIAAGGTTSQSAALANLAAGLVVGKRGTATVTTGEMLALLRPTDGRTDPQKIFSLETVSRLQNEWRAQGLKIALTNGCFGFELTFIQADTWKRCASEPIGWSRRPTRSMCSGGGQVPTRPYLLRA